MNTFDRVGYLEEIIADLGGEISGRKRLQKLIYILQERKLIKHIYDFEWGLYGVYSYDLTYDLEFSKEARIIKEEEEPELAYTHYNLSLTDDSRSNGINEQLKVFAEQSTPVLEVLSSIIYFSKENDNLKFIKDQLFELKGHLQKHFESAFKLYDKSFSLTHS